jgi:prepilin-type N-terminal cleavage/methylation domain-containing protein
MTIRGRARGVTLLELLVVLMILSIILTAAVKTWDVTLERGRAETTSRKLSQIVNVIVGNPDYIVAGHRADFGFVGDVGRPPNNLQELVVFQPVSPPESSLWRGPYLRSTFNESPDGFRIDGWGDTIIYNKDSLFVRSLGGRGYADKTRWQTVFLSYDRTALIGNKMDGQIVDVHDRSPLVVLPLLRRDSIIALLKVTLYLPSPAGKLSPREKAGASAAHFTYDAIPQGTHRLVAKYVNYYKTQRESTETTAYVTVYPSVDAREVKVRLNVDWNDPLIDEP